MARSDDVSPLAYMLAVAAGLFLAPFSLMFSGFILNLLGADYGGFWLGAGAILIAAYILLGFAFGLAAPERSWRWGLWVCLAPLTILSFFDLGVYLMGGGGIILACACTGAYAGAKLNLKYTEVKY